MHLCIMALRLNYVHSKDISSAFEPIITILHISLHKILMVLLEQFPRNKTMLRFCETYSK